jgi:hypothetical protein
MKNTSGKNIGKKKIPKGARRGWVRPTEYADLSILYDGPSDDTPEPVDEEVLPDKPEEDNTPKELEIVYPNQVRLVGDMDHRPGENAWDYLDRIAPLLVKELIWMATAPANVINARVKLDALKELLSRPMPARTVYDIRSQTTGNEFDRMSDTQVMEFVTKQIGEMKKEDEPKKE